MSDFINDQATEEWEAHGLRCAMRRSPMGTLNGYARLPLDHPCFGKHYDDIDVDVHGGLTYGCDSYGWVGFDTMHFGDVWDAADVEGERYEAYVNLIASAPGGAGEKWTVEKLKNEVELLAEQLAKMEDDA